MLTGAYHHVRDWSVAVAVTTSEGAKRTESFSLLRLLFEALNISLKQETASLLGLLAKIKV